MLPLYLTPQISRLIWGLLFLGSSPIFELKRQKKINGFGILGLSFIVVMAMVGHDLFGEIGGRMGTILGSGFFILGHIRNHHLCRKDDCEK